MTEQEKSLVSLGGKLLGNLPAQFMLVVILNALFLAALIIFLDRRDSARERLLTPILAACLEQRR